MNRIAAWSSTNSLGVGLIYGMSLFILIVTLGPSIISWLYESVFHVGVVGPHLPLWILLGAVVSAVLGCGFQILVWHTIGASETRFGIITTAAIFFIPTALSFVLIALTAP